MNDFDFNDRSHRHYVQDDRPFLTQPNDLRQLCVSSEKGMIISTVLNLFLHPVLYLVIEEARERMGAKAGR